MNNKIRTIILGGLVSASLAAPAVAGDFSSNSIIPSGKTGSTLPTVTTLPTVSGADNFSFSTGYHSQYVWRGVNFGDEMVDWSLETSVNVGGIDFTAGLWGANVFEMQGGSEVDFYVSTSKDLGFATVEVGYIFYYFHDATGGNAQEVYLGLSKQYGNTTVSATWYAQFDGDVAPNADDKGNYLEFGAEQSFGAFDAAVALGLNPLDGDFTHAQVTLSKSIELNSAVSITPYVSYSHALKTVDNFGLARTNDFVAGASLGFDF